jgi:hypothetical protein
MMNSMQMETHGGLEDERAGESLTRTVESANPGPPEGGRVQVVLGVPATAWPVPVSDPLSRRRMSSMYCGLS